MWSSTLSVPESRERHDGPLFLLYCSGPGLTPRSGVVSTVAVMPVAGQPRTASSCKSLLTTIPNALQAERCWSQSSLVKPCPGSLFLVVHGVEATLEILPHP
jgi:hypothetical protein